MADKNSKILEVAIKSLDKEFGEHTVIKGSEVSLYDNVLPTGSISLDRALGIGGYPMGTIMEIYGEPSSGKTTLALHAICEAQKLDKLCAFIDMENALDPKYAEQIGIDMSDLLISQPEYAQEALTIVDRLARTGDVGVIVVDSVASLVPKEELEGNVEKEHVARQARIMSQFLRRISGFVRKTGCLIIFVNQTRQNVGMMYGNPEVTPGGKALKFYSHVRLAVRVIQQLKNNEDVIGNRVRVKVAKNKHAAPFKSAEFDLIFGRGIDTYAEVLDLAVEEDLIVKSGSWFKYENENIAQGRNTAIQYLMDNEDIYIKLKNILTGSNAKTSK